MINVFVLFSLYAGALVLVAFLGGKLAEFGTMTHVRTQVVMSVVAGFILGIALFHLLPHAYENIEGPNAFESTMLMMALGIICMVLILHVFHFHVHEFDATDHVEGSQLASTEFRVSAQSLTAIALGLSLHTVSEGIALGVSIQDGYMRLGEQLIPGIAVFLAVFVHKPLDSYSIVSAMRAAHVGQRGRLFGNLSFACLCPLVALAVYFAIGYMSEPHSGSVIGYLMAFTAGVFLCISLSDLLPEIHFHSHDKGKLFTALAIGVSLAYLLLLFESSATHS